MSGFMLNYILLPYANNATVLIDHHNQIIRLDKFTSPLTIFTAYNIYGNSDLLNLNF